MPRQSRSRPTARPAAAPAQSRGAHTAAAPAGYAPRSTPASPAAAYPPAQTQQKAPGMLGQMAATAGSIAVGSTIGHGISSMLFGGSRDAAPPPEALAQQAQTAPVQQFAQGISCDMQAKDFTDCLKTSDVQGCTWYLEQLKACQAAAAPY